MGADLGFELGCEGERGEGGGARGAGADDAGVGDAGCGEGVGLVGWGGQARVLVLVAAGQAGEVQGLAVFEPDVVWDLRLQGVDLSFGGLGRGGGGGLDAVFCGVEAEAFGEESDVGAGDWCTETFDRWEDLLVEVVVDVGLEAELGVQHLVHGVGVLRCRLLLAVVVAADDKRHDVLGLDSLATGLQLEGHLHRWHAVALRVVLRILTKLGKDGVFVGRNTLFAHLGCEFAKVIVNLGHDSLWIFS